MKKETIHTWKEALPNKGKEGVAALYGFRRMGKTATAWWLAEQAHQRTQPVASYGFPKKARGLLPKWVQFVDTLAGLTKMKPGTFVVADELALQAHARDHQSDENKEWAKLIAVCGQCHLFLCLICQHTRQPDVSLAMDPDVVLFKYPSLLHIRFARPELRPEVKNAWDAFQKAKGDKRRWCYVVDYHQGRVGFLPSRLPSFWSEGLSTAYGRYELVNLLSTRPKSGRR